MLKPSEIIRRLKPSSWKYNKIKQLGNKIHYGFIAQDVLQEFGNDYNFVDETEEYLKINYVEFIGPMVTVLQEQADQIQQLEHKIKELEKIIKK